jgi:hypothetical protein
MGGQSSRRNVKIEAYLEVDDCIDDDDDDDDGMWCNSMSSILIFLPTIRCGCGGGGGLDVPLSCLVR